MNPMRNLPAFSISGIIGFSSVLAGGEVAFPDRFFGGTYDGFASATSTVSPASSRETVYLGGVYDGYGSELSPSSINADRLALFFGGALDGYSSEQWVASINSGRLALFYGGPLDGYSGSLFSQIVSVARSAPFFGGGHDGSDFFAITGQPNPLDGDSDGDGIPDWWEVLYFGGVLAGDALGDADGDGVLTLHEFYAATDPGDPRSVFRIVDIIWNQNGDIVITFSCSPDRLYTLEERAELDAGSWSPVVNHEDQSGDPSGFMAFDRFVTQPSRMIFRVTVKLPPVE